MNEATQDAEESVQTEKTAETEASTTTTQPEQAATAAETQGSGEAQAASAQEAAPAAEAPTTEAPAPAAEAPAKPAEPRRVVRPASMAPPPPQAQAQTPAPAAAPQPKAAAPSASEEDTAGGDIDFGAILEQFEQEQTQYHQGDLVEGKVVGITDRGVLVDFGYKSEGFVPLEEVTAADGQITVSIGETLEVVIRSTSGENGPQLSRTDALGRKVWDEIEQAYNSETPVMARVIDKTKGGLRVEVNGIEAFLPGSQIDSRPIRGLDSYIGQELETRVIKFSRRRNNIVLSRKVLTDEVVNAQKAETLSKVDVGYIVEGTIKNLTEYGAFVDIGGIDGLLHVTDMSWGRIHHPSDLFKVNDHVQVKILKLDREKEKVSLGYKQLQPDPWSTVVEVYPVDTKLTGTVSSVTDYGVFVELEPGVEGLVHVSEISWARRAQSPKRLFHKGQELEVQVLGVDTVEKRISLGMKQFQENPWDTVDLRYPIGTKIRGKVRNITDFGAFVELEEGIDGLVHVSDISWGKKIKHPKDLLKKDQEVEAVVTSIDKRNQRLSLSMKDLTPSAWEGFVATHRPGDTVKGKVSRFTNFGVFVELGDGLEGLCHISELSDDRVERPEDVASLGQEMDFRILRIEPAEQKIGLSHRAVGKEDEESASSYSDTRTFSSEAKGGMASLGELANLKFGNAPETPAEEAPKKEKKAKKSDAPAAEETETAETAPAEEAPAAEAPAEEPAPETETAAVETSTEEAPETAPAETPAEEPAATEQAIDESATSAGDTPEDSEQTAA
jgi:small subunit ribosomal protein S1